MTIRRQPQDFRVREVLSPDFPLRPAPEPGVLHGVFELHKTSLTTPHACAELAAAIGVQPRALEYAGLKDKHAVTSQHVSVRLDRLEQTSALRREVAGKGWSARLVGWSARTLAAAAIGRNHFTIVVRDLQPDEASNMQTRAAALAHPDRPAISIVNYFGDQRFASARHGQGFAARHLIRGEFEAAMRLLIGTPARGDRGDFAETAKACAAHWGRWDVILNELRPRAFGKSLQTLKAGGSFKDAFQALPHLDQQMAIESYQSLLWNEVARRLAADAAPSPPLSAPGPFGELLFPPYGALPHDWSSIEIPMPAPGVRAQPPWGGAMNAAIEAEGLAMNELQIPGVRRPKFGTALRPLLVEADSFRLGAAQADELARDRARLKREVEFSLPRGAYATVVLHALGQ